MTPAEDEEGEEASLPDLQSLGPAEDVYAASTRVAELPEALLATLRSGAPTDGSPAETTARPDADVGARETPSSDPVVEIVDLVDCGRSAPTNDQSLIDLVDFALGADEPETVELQTALLSATLAPDAEAFGAVLATRGRRSSLPPLEAPRAIEPPQTIELHVLAEATPGGVLLPVESDIGQLPRSWMIAGALVTSVLAAAVVFALLWTLARLL